MKFLLSRRWLAAIAALLLVLFLARPGVHQLRNRIANSIGSALGRRVELQNVRVHVLPRPGFDLAGLVIYDDPAFSAEPMVRAEDVSAAIRFSSLLRGRLEIATLSASEPSINLVRNPQGQWNLASLLERTAHTPVAPTGKPASERRPAFPYLEATHARINFKFGQEKKSFALTDAELALWQASENSWGARLRAQPVRTDFHLTDTGLFRMNATWQRAARIGETPFEATLRWDQGQLGQITKLFWGRDRGWRGDVSVAASLSGTPEALQIRSQVTIDDFRRYDLAGGERVRLWTVCSGRYGTVNNTFEEILCESPVSGGTAGGIARLRGRVGPITAASGYDLTLAVKQVPLSSVLRLARQAKKGLPADLAATGLLEAEFWAQKGGSEPVQLTGQGLVSDARLASNGGKDEITFGDVPFVVGGAKRTSSRQPFRKNSDLEPVGPYLRLGPLPLAMGGAAPATMGGWVAGSGYRFSLRGDTTLRSAFRLANTLGVPGQRPAAEGAARVDVVLAGSWQGFAAPSVIGTAELHNVRAEVRGFNTPIEFDSAMMTVAPDATTIEKISAQTASTHWSGSVTAPRGCTPPGCRFQFDLAADQLSTADLAGWFTPRSSKRRWYRLLNSTEPAGRSLLLAIEAKGRVRVNRLSWKKTIATQVETLMDLDRGKISLTGLRGQVFQGTHLGNWAIDVSVQPPLYQAAGILQNISLTQVSQVMNDPWAAGMLDGKFDLTGAGNSVLDVLEHGEGAAHFLMRNGSLTHVEIAGSPKPFPIHKLTGDMRLKKGTWELRAAKLESHDGIYQISGTASWALGLNLALTRGDEQSWNVTGTLAKPRLTQAGHPEVRSALKP